MSKLVSDYLNEVSYKEDDNYIPTEFALLFVNFIKLVNGGSEENTTPVLHLKMLDTLADAKITSILNMVFRGAAKTTLFGEYLILYLAWSGGQLPGRRKTTLGMYISDSMENGIRSMGDNLRFRWDNSAFLQEHVPVGHFTLGRWSFMNKAGVKVSFKGFGAKTGVRGYKGFGKRPNIAILDDLVSDEDANSPTVIDNIENTVFKAISYALDPNNSLRIWSGTPFNAKDPLYKAAETGVWKVNAFPVCETMNENTTADTFIGAWTDRFSYKLVKKLYDEAVLGGKVSAFNQEMMLRIMSNEDRLIKDEDIRWYRTEDVKRYASNFNYYITTDFATTAKSSSDYSVILVWAYNNNNDWYLVDGICARQLMDKTIDDLFRFAALYKPQSVGLEVSGQQYGFVSWIKQTMLERNINFSIAYKPGSKVTEGFAPTTDKIARFNIIVPWFKQGKIYVPADLKDTPLMLELLNELKLACKGVFRSKHDDVLDAIAMIGLLTTWSPSSEYTPNTSSTFGVSDVYGHNIVLDDDNFNTYRV